MATVNVYDFETEEQIVPVTLTASDDATINLSKRSFMVIDNITGGSLDVVVVGSAASAAFACSGVGSIDLTGGITFTVPAGEVLKAPLVGAHIEYMRDGALTITGGTGAEAYIIQIQ